MDETLALRRMVFRIVILMSVVCCGDAYAAIRVIAVGSNKSFDRDLPVLKFATSDAKRFSAAMRQVGLVNTDSLIQLLDPTVSELETALQTDSDSSGRSISKFVFYFSGHSDERGLHLRDGLLDKNRFHSLLAKIPKKTKIVIFDSCFSGALTAKGIKAINPVEFPQVDFDEPTGSIFLSATSSNSLAFESKKLQGSLFSHSLLSGLYGKADANADGVVTVMELYQYAFRESKLRRHYYASAASQVPEFAANLKGKGAVAISFPEVSLAKVLLAPEIEGEITFRSHKNLHEFTVVKQEQEQKIVGIPVDHYIAELTTKGRVLTASVTPTRNSTNLLTLNDFVATPDMASLGSKGIHLSRISRLRRYKVIAGLHAELREGRRSTRGQEKYFPGASLGLEFDNLNPNGLVGTTMGLGITFTKDDIEAMRRSRLEAQYGIAWHVWGSPQREGTMVLSIRPRLGLGFGAGCDYSDSGQYCQQRRDISASGLLDMEIDHTSRGLGVSLGGEVRYGEVSPNTPVPRFRIAATQAL